MHLLLRLTTVHGYSSAPPTSASRLRRWRSTMHVLACISCSTQTGWPASLHTPLHCTGTFNAQGQHCRTQRARYPRVDRYACCPANLGAEGCGFAASIVCSGSRNRFWYNSGSQTGEPDCKLKPEEVTPCAPRNSSHPAVHSKHPFPSNDSRKR